jgi:hypothetical protein
MDNTILLPANAQYYPDVVWLQGILNHVSSTYVAIFREIQAIVQLQL